MASGQRLGDPGGSCHRFTVEIAWHAPVSRRPLPLTSAAAGLKRFRAEITHPPVAHHHGRLAKLMLASIA